MTGKIIVFCMCESLEQADTIATSLVERQLAACVNILPQVTSVYRWKDALEKSSEVMLVIKTRHTLFEELSAEILRLHSYEVPEIVALPITAGSSAYLKWIDKELKTDE